MKQVMFQLGNWGNRGVTGEETTAIAGVSYLIGFRRLRDRSRFAILGNFLLSVSVLAGTEPSKVSQDDPRTFHCTRDADHNVAATAWLNGGPRLSVQQVQVEASLAR